MTEEVYNAFLGRRDELKQFFHGHTYTANPLACAVGVESVALLRASTLAMRGHRFRPSPQRSPALGEFEVDTALSSDA